MGETTSDIPRIVNRMELLLHPIDERSLGAPPRTGKSDRMLEERSPEEKLSGRLAAAPVAQVEV